MDKYDIILEETWLDYPSPEGNAVIVYMTGCSHHCEGCHSTELQEVREYSEPHNVIIEKIRDYTLRADTNKIVLLGGDPIHPNNLSLTRDILSSLSSDFDICIFTGYTIDIVQKLQLKGAKYYKCGRFDRNNQRKSMKTDEEYVLASPNQNFYDSNYNQLSTNGILKFK